MKNIVNYISEQQINEISSATLFNAYRKQVARNDGAVNNRARRFLKYAKEKVDIENRDAKNYNLKDYKVRRASSNYNQNCYYLSRKFSVKNGPVYAINIGEMFEKCGWDGDDCDIEGYEWCFTTRDEILNLVAYFAAKYYSDDTFELGEHRREYVREGYHNALCDIDSGWSIYDFDNVIDAFAYAHEEIVGEPVDFMQYIGKSEDEIKKILPKKFKDAVCYYPYCEIDLDDIIKAICNGDTSSPKVGNKSMQQLCNIAGEKLMNSMIDFD